MAKKIDCADLVGVRWKKGVTDCLALSVLLLRRAGMGAAAASLSACAEKGAPDGSWRELGADEPLQVGDIGLTNEGKDGIHTLCVVDPARRRAFSALRDHGGHVVRLGALRNLVGVYRYG